MNEKAKATHTPGPWAVELPYSEPGVYITQANPRMSNALICRMMDQAQAPEGRANAALIAAAPDLLEALHDCMTQEGACAIVEGTAERLLRRLREIDKVARAAIAKAEGGAS